MMHWAPHLYFWVLLGYFRGRFFSEKGPNVAKAANISKLVHSKKFYQIKLQEYFLPRTHSHH